MTPALLRLIVLELPSDRWAAGSPLPPDPLAQTHSPHPPHPFSFSPSCLFYPPFLFLHRWECYSTCCSAWGFQCSLAKYHENGEALLPELAALWATTAAGMDSTFLPQNPQAAFSHRTRTTFAVRVGPTIMYLFRHPHLFCPHHLYYSSFPLGNTGLIHLND